jgi:hypothetical protein
MLESEVPLDDILWLVSDAGVAMLDRVVGDTRSAVQLATTLRKELSAVRTHLVLEQVELRHRARVKFSQAERMFFRPVALEQATDEILAGYKAARFTSAERVADLCCGIGGDLMALASRGPSRAIDRSAVAAVLARANCEVLQLSEPPEVIVGDVTASSAEDCAAWHIDPDRRPDGRRSIRVELHEPGPEVLNGLLANHPNGAIKLAPAAETPDAWQQAAELEWISRARECRQQVAWFGGLARHPGRRAATILTSDPGQTRTLLGDGGTEPPVAPAIGRYVFEPDAAVLAAGLNGQLAVEHDLASLVFGVAYLTGDEPIHDPALSCFEVQEVLGYHPKRVKTLLRERGIGTLEVKKRGVDLAPDSVRRELDLRGENTATLILTRIENRVVAILSHRVES